VRKADARDVTDSGPLNPLHPADLGYETGPSTSFVDDLELTGG
jgi:hypothetical protein